MDYSHLQGVTSQHPPQTQVDVTKQRKGQERRGSVSNLHCTRREDNEQMYQKNIAPFSKCYGPDAAQADLPPEEL